MHTTIIKRVLSLEVFFAFIFVVLYSYPNQVFSQTKEDVSNVSGSGCDAGKVKSKHSGKCCFIGQDWNPETRICEGEIEYELVCSSFWECQDIANKYNTYDVSSNEYMVSIAIFQDLCDHGHRPSCQKLPSEKTRQVIKIAETQEVNSKEEMNCVYVIVDNPDDVINRPGTAQISSMFEAEFRNAGCTAKNSTRIKMMNKGDLFDSKNVVIKELEKSEGIDYILLVSTKCLTNSCFTKAWLPAHNNIEPFYVNNDSISRSAPEIKSYVNKLIESLSESKNNKIEYKPEQAASHQDVTYRTKTAPKSEMVKSQNSESLDRNLTFVSLTADLTLYSGISADAFVSLGKNKSTGMLHSGEVLVSPEFFNGQDFSGVIIAGMGPAYYNDGSNVGFYTGVEGSVVIASQIYVDIIPSINFVFNRGFISFDCQIRSRICGASVGIQVLKE